MSLQPRSNTELGLLVSKLLPSWTKAVETVPEKNKNCFVEHASFSISNFHISTPSRLFNVVTTRQSTLKRGRGGFHYRQKDAFCRLRKFKCVNTLVHDCRLKEFYHKNPHTSLIFTSGIFEIQSFIKQWNCNTKNDKVGLLLQRRYLWKEASLSSVYQLTTANV